MQQEHFPDYQQLHELSLAIGEELELLPMLRHFTARLSRELGLSRVDYYLLQNEQGEPVLPDAQVFAQLSHVLGWPEDLMGLMDPDIYLVVQTLRREGRGFHCEHDPLLGQHVCYVQLGELGLLRLQSIQRPFEAQLLLQWLPLFRRLTQAARHCIAHESLLRTVRSRQASEDDINFQLYHDELTRLPNRRMLMNHLSKDLARAQRHRYFGAVLFLDLNRFKVINDTFGHATGDALLIRVAEILQSIVREEDTVARLSGDEFVIQLSRIQASREGAEEAIGQVLRKIHQAFSVPLKVRQHILHVTPSIGVEIYPNRNASADDILHHADIAMYQAKLQGPNISAFFDQKRSDEIRLRLELENELKEDMETMEHFELHYQPQFDAEGLCVGAEALLRWRNPARGYISPAIFIPIAEETGLMLKLGNWVMQEACKHLAILESRGLPQSFRKLSVNVSAIQFSQKSFIQDLLEVISHYAVSRRLLGIELTESVLIKNVEDMVIKITELKDAGITTSIDDFGTGYSSLAYLTRFPIETLKIDQMFVRNMDSILGNRAVVDTIMVLGKNLRLGIIAEGVETEAELKCLREFNCDTFQGYYFKPPLPFRQLLQVLDGSESRLQQQPEFPFCRLDYRA
jgi:diguanylate cyclase (GGDEF)-like protein